MRFRTKRRLLHLSALLVVLAMLVSCGGGAATPAAQPTAAPEPTAAPAEPAANDPMAELIKAAQAEGELTTIALPHDWCNYGEVIEGFKAKYGLAVNELNPDAGSGDEVEAIRANKGNKGPQAPDVIDVGFSFGPQAQAEGLIAPYKVSTWDTIPDEVKDADGYWYGDYYGVLSFMVNKDIIAEAPQDWADLLKPEFAAAVGMSGDPRTSNQAILTVYASALANGGSLDDAQAGLDYFAQMNQAGNLVPVIANNGTVAKGETPVRITWDYNALSGADSFEGNPPVETVIPASGRLGGVYLQAISAYAPHPNAAKLWMEYLYSDEGQLGWMKGYCHPIREADMRARGVIPADLLAKLPDVSGAAFPSLEQQAAAKDVITKGWDSVVGANIQAADAAPAAPAADAMAELIKAAQAEGELTTIALPHDWCNYGEVIEGFKAKYGLTVNELNPDAGSGDEVEAIRANKGNKGPQAPDVIDVGFSFGPQAQAEGLIAPYKVSTWDTIPDEVKDADGYWYGDYYGVLSFMVNKDIIAEAPQDWADLLKPEFAAAVGMSGDPRTSNQAILTVYASALANGGSLDDAQAGLDYFAQMNQAGNLVPVIANNGTVAKGETPVRITWDYNALSGADSFEGNPPVETVIPASGRLGGVYLQAISAYAPHPNAAKLWMEYLYSDEGQLGWMKGYCHPIREADMRARGVIPADLLAKLPDVSGAAFPSLDQQAAAKKLITEGWDSIVGADVKAAE
ncbi:MAG: extracellular solute-binding protein [Caldilineales bacterium]|nr:extracellular solute-binding protein [Caldilineales bacterium]